jgi:N-acetylneuraminic acid mutarotase
MYVASHHHLLVSLILTATLVGCGGGSGGNSGNGGNAGPINIAGNWQFTANSTTFGTRDTISGSLLQNGGAITGNMVIANSPCAIQGAITGTESGDSFTGTLNEAGQEVSLSASVSSDGNSVSGTYQAPAGGCTDGDAGTLSGQRYAALAGFYSGAFQSNNNSLAPFNISATIGQSSQGNLTVAAAITGSLCFTSLNLTGVLAGASLVVSGTDSAGNALTLTGTSNVEGTSLSLNYQVTAGACANDFGTGTLAASTSGGVMITITPVLATLQVGSSKQFTATVTNNSNQSVTWEVNDVVGGNPTNGEISGTGLYTAPITPPFPSTVVITAVSQADTTETASALATITQWTSGAPIPTAVVYPAAAVLGNQIYVVGGSNTTGVISDTQIYNPSTNTWSTGTPLPMAVAFPSAAVVNGVLYVFGGQTSNGSATDLVWGYNPGTKQWTAEAAMPTATWSTAAVVENDIIYVIGGTVGTASNYNYVANVESYNPATNTWTEEAPMLVSKSQPAAALLGTTIVVADGALNGGLITGDNEGYDATTNTWSELAADPTARVATCFGSIGQEFYDVGGYPGVTLTESYTLSTNEWNTNLAPIPVFAMFPGSAVYGGKLYCIGGESIGGGPPLNTVQIYPP